ncbi:LOW QUALITY PROTEIN: hypothetical protein JCM19039_4342 [Geomicrobium sp. JCM 19039]|nr:LOW QUALITY PROTEIN: hypothetical protein JCM19039_4342 [Geomicrobium sp. JCM 19039]
MKAFYNGTIFNGDGEKYEGQALLIEDGKVKQIVKEGDIPSQAEKVDVRGGYITPGFIDVHTHLGVSEEGIGQAGQDFNETSDPVTPEVRALDGLNPLEEGFQNAIRTGVTTVQVLPGSANVIGGEMCTVKTSGSIADHMAIAAPSGMKAAFGENPKRVYGSRTKKPITRMGIASIFREEMYRTKEYMEKRKAGTTDFKLGYEQLAKVLRKEIPFRIHAHRADDIVTVLRLKKEFDFDLTLEHGTEAHLIADHVAMHDVSVSVGPTMSPKSKIETSQKSWHTLMELEMRGVNIAITTDHPVIAIEHLLVSASKAITAGLSEKTAMKAVTSNAAKHLGLENRIGHLASGMDADFAIWTDHPFHYASTHLSTWINGEKIEPTV